jgi:hypothetical protein
MVRQRREAGAISVEKAYIDKGAVGSDVSSLGGQTLRAPPVGLILA